jgi:gliding motility-associated-like protein
MRLLLICLILFSTKLTAQKEGNWWFFGNTSSLDFTTNPPTVSSGSGMFTYDNSSAVSDQNGQLLFYTNGVTIWNRFHIAMTNGTGLSGSNSGGQSALIVPQPNSNLYYVFTVPNHGTGALRYTVVDMTLSGGNGAVTLKNQGLHTPTTEKLDSYYDCLNNRYKIISHQYGNNNFYVYEINSSGLNLTPVISAIGNVHSGGSASSSHDAMGQLTISPDGSLIASGQQFNNFIQIFDFNVTTGIVSNPRTIGSFSPWGLSFSRNGKMLYATHWINTSVDQIDLTNPAAPGAPISIGNVTGTTGGYGAGYLQLAPNDKIYIAKWASPYLSIIDSPNSLGVACNFIDNGINLGSVVSQAGVCRTVTTAQAPLTILSNSNCTTTSFELNDTSGITAITWNFGAGTTSNLLFPTYPFAAGNHPVTVYVTRCNYVDTISTIITVATNSTTSQFTVTNTNCSNTVTLNNQSANATTYTWNWGNGQSTTGAQTSYTYPAPGNYIITLISYNGACSDTSTQNVTVAAAINANFTFTTGCANDINVTNLSSNATTYTWNWGNGQSSTGNAPNYTYPAAGTFNVSLIAYNGACSDTSTQQVIIPPGITTTAILTPGCNQNLNISNFSTTATSILWNWGNGIQTSGPVTNYTYPAPGNYTVSLILSTASCNDTIFTNVVISAPINSSFTATPGCNQVVSLTNNSTNATNYTWQWGNSQQSSSNLNSYTYPAPGNYTISLIAQNGNCSDTSQQPITVLPSVVAAFTATANCNQGINITNQSQNGSNYNWTWGDGNTTSNNPNYYQYTNSGNYTISMIALNGLCSDTSVFNVQVDTFPVAQINHTMNGCRDSVQFQSVNPSTSLSWNFGNGSSSNATNASSYYPNSGNYNVTLITANSFCTDTATLPISLPGDPNASTTYSLSCDGILSVNPVIDPAWTYTWYFGDGNSSSTVSPVHTYANSGQYQLSLVVDNGYCQDSLSQTLVYSTPSTYTIQSTLDSCSLLATFNLNPAPIDPVLWSFGDGSTSTSISPTHQYGISNHYTIQAIINPLTACADTIDYSLDLSTISSLENIFLPNSFTPNGDLVNDVYRVENISCDELSISIYNRWGTLVFKSNIVTNSWNGKYKGQDLPQGVYIIVAKNRKKTKTGTITLLR